MSPLTCCGVFSVSLPDHAEVTTELGHTEHYNRRPAKLNAGSLLVHCALSREESKNRSNNGLTACSSKRGNPCPTPSMMRSVESTPEARNASSNEGGCSSGTGRSSEPCVIRRGACHLHISATRLANRRQDWALQFVVRRGERSSNSWRQAAGGHR